MLGKMLLKTYLERKDGPIVFLSTISCFKAFVVIFLEK